MIEDLNRALIDFLRDHVVEGVIQSAHADVIEVRAADLPALVLVGPTITPNRFETHMTRRADGPIGDDGRRPVVGPDSVVDLSFEVFLVAKAQGGEDGILELMERFTQVLNENKQLSYAGESYDMDGFTVPLTYKTARDGLGNKTVRGEIRLTSIPLPSSKRLNKSILKVFTININRKEV